MTMPKNTSMSLYRLLFEQQGTTNTLQPEVPAVEDELAPLSVEGEDEEGFVDVEELSAAFEEEAELIRDTLEGLEEPEPGVDDPDPVGSSETTVTGVELEEELLGEQEEVLEEDAASKALAMTLVGKSGNTVVFGGTKSKVGVSGYRFKLVDPKADLDVILKKTFKGLKVKEILPGQPGSLSGKYRTFVVKIKDEKISVVFCAGQNRGQKFEQQLKNSISSRKGASYQSLLAALKTFYGIKESQIVKINKKAGGNKKVTRPLVLKMVDVGAALSDMDVFLTTPITIPGTKATTDVIRVSIKDVNGGTFANTGYSGAFTEKLFRGKTVVKVSTSPYTNVEEFVTKQLGVSKERIAAGLTDYTNQVITKNKNITEIPNANFTAVKETLAANLGYGYLYVRNQGGSQDNPSLKFQDLYTPQKALDMIGDVQSVTVKYPYFFGPDRGKSSKQCTIDITTEKGKFRVEIRSTRGGPVTQSLQCNIKIMS